MTDAKASAAARELSRQRWGTRRVDTLIAELTERREQLQPVHVKALRRVLEPARQERP
jgi:hypothetical protein